MKTILPLAAVAALFGCVMHSTYSSIQERDPAIAFQTEKSVDEYLSCLHPRMVDIWPSTSLVNDGDAKVLTAAEPQMLAAVTIRPSGSGAAVEYRQINDMTVANFGRAREAVNACR